MQDRYLNGRIHQMATVTQMPSLSKPYNVRQVRAQLPLIEHSHPTLYHELDRLLSPYEQKLALTYSEVTVAAATDPDNGKLLPNARGEQLNSSYRVTAQGQYRPADWLVVNVGGLAYDSQNEVIPVGSYVAVGNDSIQLDFGYREHWLSPFHESAMVHSTNAQPSVSVGLSNPMPLENWWNLKYDIFFTRLEHMDGVRIDGEWLNVRPGLTGFHMSIEPIAGWVIGANRTIQFNGGDDGISLKEIWQAFFNPTADQQGNASDNQIASLTSKMHFGGPVPFVLYAEYAGEDTVQLKNTRLGNLAVSAGIHLPFMPQWLLGPDWSLTYEFTEHAHAWYSHHIFRQGYSNNGVVMGHWAGNDRCYNSNGGPDSVGSQIHTARLGYQRAAGSRYELAYRSVDNRYNGRETPMCDYEVGRDIELSHYGKLMGHPWGWSLFAGQTVHSDNFARLEISLGW
ncbi:hypothetical protein GCM10023333_29520 [Ferrimonas pelagia]|uniref:Capsule assembly Wzi family protein n=2 Tax=Ferrimonas pelagia TaxID=1177826 RepID=A0ABP9F7K2_9GAMM